MVKPKRSKVSSDIKNNRLYITMPTVANKSELNKIYTDIRFCVADLKPGFDVINDLSYCKIGHLNAVGIYKKISDYLVVCGVGRIIRITGKKSLISTQALAFSERFIGYKCFYTSSLEEAEEELNKPVKPKALRFHIHERQVEYEAGQKQQLGYLIDMSTTGCAVKTQNPPLSVDQEVTINVQLYKQVDSLSPFVLPATVVRVLDDQFAVRFIDIDQKQKDELYQCLVNELKRVKV